jgi:uncharacterized protein
MTPLAPPFKLPPAAHVGFGQVHHARQRPTRHQFTYGNWFLWLPMRTRQPTTISTWQPNQAGPMSFYDEDHGIGTPQAQGGAMPWLLDLLAAHGIADGGGDVWLQTYPRVWGYGFRPVSFWYCFEEGTDSPLAAVVAEVNNTFGERHCYVLPAPQWGQTQRADKAFHVSPFARCRATTTFAFRAHRAPAVRAFTPASTTTTRKACSSTPTSADVFKPWIARRCAKHCGATH